MNLTRRELLLTLPSLALVPRAFAQTRPQIQLKGFNHFKLLVTDVKRSVDFYQSLFGMPIQARQGSTVVLRMGTGPQFIAIAPAGSAAPSISQMGLAVENFNADRLAGILAQHGFTRSDAEGPMKMQLKTREGTPELFLQDLDGIRIQLQDVSYCGGSGPLGNVCSKIEPSPKKPLLAVKEISHFTNSMSDAAKANEFYQNLFGLHVRSKQGAALGLGVGPGIGFVMFTGGGGGARGGAAAAPRVASIGHVCMNLPNFNVESIQKTLATVGITPRGEAQGGPTGPLKTYISMRMPNRGGAEGGTPELYFTDPDGLAIQLQDVTYCGGGGYLGNELCV
jgi:catechol 2,3-dioxygenase-like lactoylglutathione lyase family enzyme